MKTYRSKDYKGLPFTAVDREISLIIWGFTLAFLYLTGWKAFQQTQGIHRRQPRSAFVLLIWIELVANFFYGLFAWLMIQGHLETGLFPLAMIIVSWAFEIQALPQIILNRVALIKRERKQLNRIRWGIFLVFMVVIIVVSNTWIPGVLQIAPIYMQINVVFDRIEKFLYATIDVCLNIYFIHSVKHHLVDCGLQKYYGLVKFNQRIILVSVLMDGLIIGMMFYPQPLVYLQMHPLAFTVKLNIEISMASLIAKIARDHTQNPTCSGALSGQDTLPIISAVIHDEEGKADNSSDYTVTAAVAIIDTPSHGVVGTTGSLSNLMAEKV